VSESETTPVACTLGSSDLAEQIRRWNDLRDRAGLERVETEKGLRLYFAPGAGVEDELRKLVAVEQDCCAWADWAVDVRDVRLVLCVCSTGEGVTALHGMFAG
jgi:hypothetical protein